MKNWKYIDGAKVGNIKDDKKSQQLWEEMQHAKKLAEDWAREIHRTGKEEYKGSQKDAEEAYRKAKREYEKYAMNAKTGNAESFDEFVKKLAKEKPELYQSLWNAGQMEALKSYYHKITGNATPAEYFSKKPKVIGNEKTGVEGFFKQLSDDVKEREKKDDKEIEKVGNRIDWSENLVGKNVWVKDKGEEWKVYVLQDKGDKVYIRDDEDGSQGWVSKERITGKVGNSAHSDKVDVIKRLLNAKWSVDEIFSLLKKEGYEVEKSFIERLKTGNSDPEEEYWKKQYIESARKKGVPEREIQEFIKKIEKEGAKGVMIPVKNSASEYEILKQDPSKMHPLYKKAYEEAMKKLAREDEDFKKRFEKEYGVKAKNEAPDDKFAYVMREFDEGKLKTPDGKVVTDPAQAKAIAYSESKKTENGLARARMAMNARSITYDDFLRKLENAINQSRDSVSFQMYGISDEIVEAWVQKAKKEGYSQYIRDVRGAEVNLND